MEIACDYKIPYIDKIVSIIVSLASPDQIILFGSYAQGKCIINNAQKQRPSLLGVQMLNLFNAGKNLKKNLC